MPDYQTQASPAAEAGDKSLTKKQVVRGAADLNKGVSVEEGFRMAQQSVRPGQGSLLGPDSEATEDEQREYERAMNALGKVLYENEKTSDAIVKQLDPGEKVGGVAKASMLVLTQIDEKLDIDEVVIPQLAQDIVDRVIDLYENVNGDEFSEQEATAAMGATWEGLMEAYGIDEADYAELTAGMTDKDISGYKDQYKNMVGDPY